MKASAKTLPRKTTVILLVGLAALVVWIPQQRKLAQARLAVEEAKGQRVKLEERVATATAELESVRRELRGQQSNRTETLAAVAKAEQELARVDPEGLWLALPPALPDWNADAPYVWLRKEMLPKLGVSVFTDDGELGGDIAAVLTLTESQQRSVSATLPSLLAEYRALEVANAERVDESVSGAGKDGPKVTVRIKPLPEEGAWLKQQVELALRTNLGEQRGALLLELSSDWLNSQFSHFGTAPKTISVARGPNGGYSIEIHDWNSQQFTTGVPRIDPYIPAHLLPLFSDVLGEAAPATPAAVSTHEK